MCKAEETCLTSETHTAFPSKKEKKETLTVLFSQVRRLMKEEWIVVRMSSSSGLWRANFSSCLNTDSVCDFMEVIWSYRTRLKKYSGICVPMSLKCTWKCCPFCHVHPCLWNEDMLHSLLVFSAYGTSLWVRADKCRWQSHCLNKIL